MLCGVIASQGTRRGGWLLPACCAATAGWAAVSAALPGDVFTGLPGALDLVRALAWFGFILHLYRRYVPAGEDSAGRAFALIGIAALPLAVAAGWMDWQPSPGQGSLWSLGVIVRLGVAVCSLLLIENVYFNVPETNRWHVALPCVLLGLLACFDVLICAMPCCSVSRMVPSQARG